ncbi:MAG: regulatory signaling modulator protein AmpE [Gammaproteobacteria bacterium]|nr:regulatory signaling modulator protein AmpE [Gammaproteobacteria bacterium]
MSLLAILFGLAIERFFDNIENKRNFDWSVNFSNWVRHKFSNTGLWNDTLGLIVIILIPVFSCAIIYSLLYDALSLLGFAFAVFTLVYSLGPQRIHQRVRLYIDASEFDDQHSAKTYAIETLGNELPDDNDTINKRICEKLIIATNDNILGVFFWFVLLGPMGALLYRIASTLYEHAENNSNESEYGEFHNSSRLLFAILVWIPNQLTMLCFAVTGSFIDAFQQWKEHIANDYLNPAESNETLVASGLSALQINSETHSFELSTVNNVLALCWRSIIVWVTALALMTLAGWAG